LYVLLILIEAQEAIADLLEIVLTDLSVAELSSLPSFPSLHDQFLPFPHILQDEINRNHGYGKVEENAGVGASWYVGLCL
jgi:hypothetical protein